MLVPRRVVLIPCRISSPQDLPQTSKQPAWRSRVLAVHPMPKVLLPHTVRRVYPSHRQEQRQSGKEHAQGNQYSGEEQVQAQLLHAMHGWKMEVDWTFANSSNKCCGRGTTELLSTREYTCRF